MYSIGKIDNFMQIRFKKKTGKKPNPLCGVYYCAEKNYYGNLGNGTKHLWIDSNSIYIYFVKRVENKKLCALGFEWVHFVLHNKLKLTKPIKMKWYISEQQQQQKMETTCSQ